MDWESQVRTYWRSESVTFRKTSELFGGLSNMAPGFPVQVNGIRIRTSEALYQACRFPHSKHVQQLIISEHSPMTAKMRSKQYTHESRSDWNQVRIDIMRWALRVKLCQNWESFSSLILSTGNQYIVEESSRDSFWGAIPQESGDLRGVNGLGRLLMHLRSAICNKDQSGLLRVEPLGIDNFVLFEKPILSVKARVNLLD